MKTNFAADIPREIANRAHAWTSYSPEQRGEQEIDGYAQQLSNDFDTLQVLAAKAPDAAEALARLADEFPRYRTGYRRRFLVYLERRARCASTMITGGSNFNKARNDKANRACDKTCEDLQDFRARALAAMRKTIRPDLAPIMAGDTNAVERLEAEIVKLEKLQERMKAANAAIRKHAKAGVDAQVAALAALGLPADLLKPDFCGRIGFPTYELTNNGANIRRLKGRLVGISRAKATPETVTASSSTGIRVEDAPADNRVRIFFPDKPNEVIRAGLKANGFRWTPSLGCWQAYRNHAGLTHAAKFAEVK